ncbi:hypothetical protein [Dickeya oryzae]|uniref:hypothetical protein n=1 Tax=Dickeya oryzae TaxID=1240404 RepID=UPI001AEC9001|nr:hypothetical protein [Dickeya oryzae]MBP2847966.1 hypothetical protein [Dickeya oryzae]
MNKYRDVAKNNHAVPDVFSILALQAICCVVSGDTTSAMLPATPSLSLSEGMLFPYKKYAISWQDIESSQLLSPIDERPRQPRFQVSPSGRPPLASGRHWNVTSNPTQDSVFISQFTDNDMNI